MRAVDLVWRRGESSAIPCLAYLFSWPAQLVCSQEMSAGVGAGILG